MNSKKRQSAPSSATSTTADADICPGLTEAGALGLYEAMSRRRSIRTFQAGYNLSTEERRMLLQACRCTATPFGSDITMTLIDARPDGTPRRLGTYGVISGATAFLAIATGPSVSSELAAGYAGERTVLKCTEAGLGTCWLGGTFRHGQFAAQARTAPGQNVRLVIAIGRPAENMRLLERVSRSLAGSDRRKPFGELFGGAPSLLAPGSPLQRALEAVRIAPSSVNSQPWRATVTPDGAVTFSNAGRSALNDVDLGIACCHFDVACRALGLDYSLTGPGMRFEPRHDGSQAHF